MSITLLQIVTKSLVSHFNTALLLFISDSSVQKEGFHISFTKGMFSFLKSNLINLIILIYYLIVVVTDLIVLI